MGPLNPKTCRRMGAVSILLTVSILMTACYFEASSTDLALYQQQNGEFAHEPQIQMMLNDFKGLSSETLSTNAVPWKVAVAAVVMKRNRETGLPVEKATFNQVLREYGFILPSKIENLKAGVPQPNFEYPIGLIRGQLNMQAPMPLRAELGNITCAVCHAGRTYDAKGFPKDSVWLGAPNTSINLQGYTDEVYKALKDLRGNENDFFRTVDRIYPNMDDLERTSLKRYLIFEVERQISVFEQGSDTILSYFNGPPGGANAIGSFKRVFGIYYPGYFTDFDRGFVNIPDLSYRAFRRNLTVDGIYTPLGETPLTPVTEKEATLERAKSLGTVAAIFPIPVMGVTAARTESNISVMKEVFGNFIYNYRAPSFPGVIDSAKALRGEQIFKSKCSQCHGDYSPGVDHPRLLSYPNKLIPLDRIGTDPARVQAVTPALARKMSESWIGQALQTEMHQGYMAPVLANLWSSAPYLHNGSIPTLWALMNPSERPEKFYTGGHALDFEKVGISYPAGYQPWSKPVLVDTTQVGLSNKGHERQFEGLSVDQKKDLIEYLKVL